MHYSSAGAVRLRRPSGRAWPARPRPRRPAEPGPPGHDGRRLCNEARPYSKIRGSLQDTTGSLEPPDEHCFRTPEHGAARLVRGGCERQDARPPRHPARHAPARQAQGRVHARTWTPATTSSCSTPRRSTSPATSSRDKIYYRHTGDIGGIKSQCAREDAEPSTRSARSSSRSRACCRRTRSAAPCSRSCTCSRAASTRTPRSSPSRSTSDLRSSHDAREHELRHRPPQDLHGARLPAPGHRQDHASTTARSMSSSAARPRRMIVRQPLETVQMADRFDVDVQRRRRRHHRPGRRDPPRHHARADGLRRVAAQAAAQAGFVTRDAREVERKKVGLRKARRGTQFSKR